MIVADVIIVGGGPAGSTCAWKLRQAGVGALLLDRTYFPRPKPCAGWITPRVLHHLEITEASYPHSLRRISSLTFHFPRVTIPVPTQQYAIRRTEFDDWLLKRSGVEVHHHDVKEIRRDQDQYVIDGTYRSRILIGAGGSACPVYRTFFRQTHPHPKEALITALEAEFQQEVQDRRVHLWFGQNNLAGYSWYLPKEGGYLNIGVGGFAEALKSQGRSIQDHWNDFLVMLKSRSLLQSEPQGLRGHAYSIRSPGTAVQIDRCYLLGDAAGLATQDTGEGIGPAVQSGILAARSIVDGAPYTVDSIRKRSRLDILLPWTLRR